MPTEVYYEDATMTLHMAVETAGRQGVEAAKFGQAVDFIFTMMMDRKHKLATEYDRAPRRTGGGGGGGGGGFAKKWEDTAIPCEVCGTGHMKENNQYQPEGVGADGSVKSNPNGPWMKCSNQTWNNEIRKPEGCMNTVWDRETIEVGGPTLAPAPAPVARSDYGPDEAPF